MTIVHNFRDQLQWSEAAGYEPFWDAVYKKAFPSLVGHMVCSGNTQGQRMGVDRLLYLSNNLTISIDEKKRREVYTDVLLEYVSVDTTGAPGWMEKDLAIDYLAYAFIPTRKCYLFPWQLLRRSWLHHKSEWIDSGKRQENGFRIVSAKNNGYRTLSVAVPIHILKETLRRSLAIDVSADLSDWNEPDQKHNC